MRLNVRIALAGLSAFLLSACQSLYFHDADLAKRTAQTANAVDVDVMLAPFAQSVSSYEAVLNEEDKAAIEIELSLRERQLSLLAATDDTKRKEVLDGLLRKRLENLFGDDVAASFTQPATSGTLPESTLKQLSSLAVFSNQFATKERERIEDWRMSSDQLIILRREFATSLGASDTSCNTLLTAVIPDPGPLKEMREECDTIKKKSAALVFHTLWPDDYKSGRFQSSLTDIALASSGADPSVDEVLKKIEADLEAAKKAAGSTAAQRFEAFISALDKNLGSLTGAAEEAALESLNTEFLRVQTAFECRALGETANEAEAGCETLSGQTTENKTKVWIDFFAAVADTEDAFDNSIRPAIWLESARTLVKARRETARLHAEAEKQRLQFAKKQFQSLVTEASALAQARLVLNGYGAPYCSGDAVACAAQLYSESVELGAAPALVYEHRYLRSNRYLSLLLRREALQLDAALLGKAAAQLKEYAEGGIKPDLTAEGLIQLGILGEAADD